MKIIFKKIATRFNNNVAKVFFGEDVQRVGPYELTEKHITNLRAIPNREKLLRLLPQHSIVAEIGVDKGIFSEKILKITFPAKLHLIDCWNSKRYHKGLRKLVEDKFKHQIEKGKVEINVGLSTDLASSFKNNYFDWIYIDTVHSYETTKAELEKFSCKVKKNGIIAGHDFITGNWRRLVRYGVIEAVSEFCIKNNWEIIYLTMERKEPPSFALRRILK